jgi:hypothetical protein
MRIKLDPSKSVEERVIEGMKESSLDRGARRAGLDYKVYTYLRKLFLLRESRLTESDKKKILAAVRVINMTGRLAAARRISEEVVNRNWPLLEANNVLTRVRRGMELHPKSSDRAALAVGLGKARFAMVRKLLVIAERHLSADDRDLLEATLKKIEAGGDITGDTMNAVSSLLSRHWTRAKEKPHQVKKKNKAFEMTMMHICEGCENTKDIVIPKEMTQRERDKAISALATSSELISRLIKRLLGEQVHHEDKEAS